jgi:hypothetical protein
MANFEKRVEGILKKFGLIGTPSPFTALPMIYIGRVISDLDPWQSGEIRVQLPHLGKSVPVNYTTPYHGKSQGSGFWAVPEVGTQVIVGHLPTGDPLNNTRKEYYYMGSVVSPPLSTPLPGSTPNTPGVAAGGVLPDSDIYRARMRPMKYVWKSPKGHTFAMSDMYDPTFFQTSIHMKSGLGKAVICDDSPQKSCILIQNEHGDHIKLATNLVHPHQSSRSLDIDTRGNQSYLTRVGGMIHRVLDGQNLDIVNTSTGLNAAEGSVNWGKVNILAQNNDVTITANEGKGTAMEDMPSIFITTNGSTSTVQIDSRGKMVVQVNQTIHIEAEEDDIDIRALKGDINITADLGDINLSTPEGKIYLN